MKNPFWHHRLLGRTHDFGYHVIEGALGGKAFDDRATFNTYSKMGTLDDKVMVDTFIERLRGLRKSLFVVYHKHPTTKNGDEVWVLADDDTAINVDITHKTKLTAINIVTHDEKLCKDAIALTQLYVKNKATKGRVYIVAQGDTGPYLHELGAVGETFEPTNYQPQVVESYRHVIADLNKPSDEACGCVVILDGPPGTGKTHMIRAMLNEVPRATFILVPSNMVSSLGGPQFVRVLLREQRKGHPLVLLIEDADECLASRKSDNQSEISALLNFGDGIFGKSLDLRIVATTNIEMTDLDGAVTRARRLCRRIEVGKLTPEQAGIVYERLVKKDPNGLFTLGNYYTLAEVYQAAFGGGGVEGQKPKNAKGRLGFYIQPEEEVRAPASVPPGSIVTNEAGEPCVVHNDGSLEKLDVEDDDSDLIDEDPDDDDNEYLDDEEEEDD